MLEPQQYRRVKAKGHIGCYRVMMQGAVSQYFEGTVCFSEENSARKSVLQCFFSTTVRNYYADLAGADNICHGLKKQTGKSPGIRPLLYALKISKFTDMSYSSFLLFMI